MHFVRASLVLTAVAIILPVAAQAQSLGEIAARERQKREAQKKPPAKVLTEADLERAKGTTANIEGVTPGAGEESTLAGAEGTKPDGTAETKKVEGEKSEEEQKAEQQAAWRKKVEAAEKKLKAYQDAQAKLQNDLNDPNLGYYTQNRTTIQELIEDSKKNIAAAQAELETLAAEGRSKTYRR
jgi:hypothetical protein